MTKAFLLAVVTGVSLFCSAISPVSAAPPVWKQVVYEQANTKPGHVHSKEGLICSRRPYVRGFNCPLSSLKQLGPTGAAIQCLLRHAWTSAGSKRQKQEQKSGPCGRKKLEQLAAELIGQSVEVGLYPLQSSTRPRVREQVKKLAKALRRGDLTTAEGLKKGLAALDESVQLVDSLEYRGSPDRLWGNQDRPTGPWQNLTVAEQRAVKRQEARLRDALRKNPGSALALLFGVPIDGKITDRADTDGEPRRASSMTRFFELSGLSPEVVLSGAYRLLSTAEPSVIGGRWHCIDTVLRRADCCAAIGRALRDANHNTAPKVIERRADAPLLQHRELGVRCRWSVVAHPQGQSPNGQGGPRGSGTRPAYGSLGQGWPRYTQLELWRSRRAASAARGERRSACYLAS